MTNEQTYTQLCALASALMDYERHPELRADEEAKWELRFSKRFLSIPNLPVTYDAMITAIKLTMKALDTEREWESYYWEVR